MDYKELNNIISEMKDEILSSIQESIRIPSVKGEPLDGAPYGPEPKRALEHALRLGRELGFQVKNVDDRSGYVEYGEGEEMVGVLGHLDVVPAGEGWHYPAFGAQIHEGRMYGRGVLDDKGPTIGAIYALKALRESGIKLTRRVRVIFGTDEENGSTCIRHYVSSGEELPTTGFTPDGDYPLIFCEKGMTTLTAGKKAVLPGKVKVLEFHGGSAKNIVTEKCRLVLEGHFVIPRAEGITTEYRDGNTIIEAQGTGSHGSKPELGINAAIRLLKSVKDIDLGGSFGQMRDFLLENIGTETNGKTLGILYQDEETGETTVNLGVLDYAEDTLSFSLDIRYPQNGIHKEVYAKTKTALKEYGLEILDCSKENVLYIPKDSTLVQKLMKVYKYQTGRDDEPMAIGGGTYAKMFPNMVAFGPQFPDAPDVIHKPDENALVEEIIKSIQLTAAAMAELAR